MYEDWIIPRKSKRVRHFDEAYIEPVKELGSRAEKISYKPIKFKPQSYIFYVVLLIVLILALLSVGIWLVSTEPTRVQKPSPEFDELSSMRKMSGGVMIAMGLILIAILWYTRIH